MAALAADDDQAFANNLLFISLLLVGGYVAVNWLRNSQAARAEGWGGFSFPQFAPGAAWSPTIGAFDLLVPMQLSPTGAAFIKAQENFSPNPYPDGRGHTSIGYGHQIQPGEQFTPPISRAEADTLFSQDADKFAAAVNKALKVGVSQPQFDALVSLAYTIGIGAFDGSTLLRLLNAGDYSGAAQQFAVWNQTNGAFSSDLAARRAQEAAKFLS